MEDIISLESLWGFTNLIALITAFLLVVGFILALIAFLAYAGGVITDGGPAALVKDIAKHIRLTKDAVTVVKRERDAQLVVDNIKKQVGVEDIETREDLDRVLQKLAAELAWKECQRERKPRRFYRD